MNDMKNTNWTSYKQDRFNKAALLAPHTLSPTPSHTLSLLLFYRHTDIQTHKQTDTETHRRTETQAHRHRDTQRDTETYRETYIVVVTC